MSEQDNLRTVEAVYAAFGRGDLGALLNTLGEDVVWEHPGPADIPWAGDRRGRDEVAPVLHRGEPALGGRAVRAALFRHPRG